MSQALTEMGVYEKQYGIRGIRLFRFLFLGRHTTGFTHQNKKLTPYSPGRAGRDRLTFTFCRRSNEVVDLLITNWIPSQLRATTGTEEQQESRISPMDAGEAHGTRRPRLAECHPEGSIDIFERWARPVFLQRRQLLP